MEQHIDQQSMSNSTFDPSMVDANGNIEAPQPNPNRSITEYVLIRIIGTGTFGKVYLATYKGKSYALKMLHKKKIIELK